MKPIYACALIFWSLSLSAAHYLPLTDQEKEMELNWLFDKVRSSSYIFSKDKKILQGEEWSHFREYLISKLPITKTHDDFMRLKQEFLASLHDLHVSLNPQDPWDRLQRSLGVFGRAFVLNTEKEEYGVLVTRLHDSVAYFQSSAPHTLQVGDIILTVNGERYWDFIQSFCVIQHTHRRFFMESAAQLFLNPDNLYCDLFQLSKEITLEVLRDDQIKTVSILYDEPLSILDFWKREYQIIANEYGSLLSADDLDMLRNMLREDHEVRHQTQPFHRVDDRSPLLISIDFQNTLAFIQKKIAHVHNQREKSQTPFLSFTQTPSDPSQFLSLVFKDSRAYQAALYFSPSEGKMAAVLKIKTFNMFYWHESDFRDLAEYIRVMQMADPDLWIFDMTDNPGGHSYIGHNLLVLFFEQPFTSYRESLVVSDRFLKCFLDQKLPLKVPYLTRTRFQVIVEAFKDALSQGKHKTDPLPMDYWFSLDLDSLPQRVLSLKPKQKIAVLMNTNCASMCEIFTSVLKDKGSATLYGEQTAGATGGIYFDEQAPFSGDQLILTSSELFLPDGSSFEEVGLTPDIPIQFTFQDFVTDYSDAISYIIKNERKLK